MKSICHVDRFGTKRWVQEIGTNEFSSAEFFLLHREDGPAVEYTHGTKEWYINGNRHRKDEPAIEYSYGAKQWYLNNLLHREDGPAVERHDGSKAWYYHGKKIDCKDNQEFLRIVKLIAFL